MTDQSNPAGFTRGLPSQLGDVTMFTPAMSVDEHITDTLRAKAATLDTRVTESV